MTGHYEVMNPWAEVDPTPCKGLAPRVADLEGKTVGLYDLSYKAASRPILTVVERKLRERFPTAKFIWFVNPFNQVVADMEYLTDKYFVSPELKAKFEKWVKEVDAVVAAIGD